MIERADAPAARSVRPLPRRRHHGHVDPGTRGGNGRGALGDARRKARDPPLGGSGAQRRPRGERRASATVWNAGSAWLFPERRCTVRPYSSIRLATSWRMFRCRHEQTAASTSSWERARPLFVTYEHGLCGPSSSGSARAIPETYGRSRSASGPPWTARGLGGGFPARPSRWRSRRRHTPEPEQREPFRLMAGE
jgi:hypothetical protein